MLSQWVIALLVASASAILAYVALRIGDAAVMGAKGGLRHALANRLLAAVAEVPVPSVIRRRWDTPGLARRLTQSASAIEPAHYMGLRWGLLWLGVAASLGLLRARHGDLLGLFLAATLLAAGAIGPGLWLSLRMERRQTEIDLALPDLLDRLALGLQAGLGFEIALRRVSANFPGHLGEVVRRAVRQLDRGHARGAAMDEMVRRTPSHDLQAFAASVKQADRLGTSLAKTLRVQSELLRGQRRRRAQEASRRLPILIVFPLVFFFLPALMIIYLSPPLLLLFLGE